MTCDNSNYHVFVTVGCVARQSTVFK